MALYVELTAQQLIAFANGATFNTHTLAAPGSNIKDTAPALETITNSTNAWSLIQYQVSMAMTIYLLTHA